MKIRLGNIYIDILKIISVKQGIFGQFLMKNEAFFDRFFKLWLLKFNYEKFTRYDYFRYN